MISRKTLGFLSSTNLSCRRRRDLDGSWFSKVHTERRVIHALVIFWQVCNNQPDRVAPPQLPEELIGGWLATPPLKRGHVKNMS